MTTGEDYTGTLAKNIAVVLREWKNDHWNYQIRGNNIVFLCHGFLDTCVRVSQGNPFPSRILHLEPKWDGDVTNDTVRAKFISEIYPLAFERALRTLSPDIHSEFVSLCMKVVVQIPDGDLVIPIPTEPESTIAKKVDSLALDSSILADDDEKKKSVFIVFGRNEDVVNEVTDFIESLGLTVITFPDAKSKCPDTTPHNLDIVKKGMSLSGATVIIFSPDDEARLCEEFHNQEKNDSTELKHQGQPRANVFFEAGAAMIRDRPNTVLTELGKIRVVSDIVGLHTVRLDFKGWNRQLLDELKKTGCEVNLDSSSLEERPGIKLPTNEGSKPVSTSSQVATGPKRKRDINEDSRSGY